jgi:uncharacterized integral membrane protein
MKWGRCYYFLGGYHYADIHHAADSAPLAGWSFVWMPAPIWFGAGIFVGVIRAPAAVCYNSAGYRSQEGATMRWLILLPILIVALLLVTFGVQNTQLVTVRFLTLEARDLSASIVIILSAIGGALLAGMIGVWNSIQHSLRDRRASKQRAQLEARVAELERQLAATKAPAAKEPVAAPAAPAAPASTSAEKNRQDDKMTR